MFLDWQEEPFLFVNGTGYVPELLSLVGDWYAATTDDKDTFPYDIIPVNTWSQLMTRASTAHWVSTCYPSSVCQCVCQCISLSVCLSVYVFTSAHYCVGLTFFKYYSRFSFRFVYNFFQDYVALSYSWILNWILWINRVVGLPSAWYKRCSRGNKWPCCRTWGPPEDFKCPLRNRFRICVKVK